MTDRRQPVVSPVLRQNHAKICAPDDLLGPRNEPTRDVGIPVKCEHYRLPGGAVADEIREEPHAVGGCVIDPTRVDRPLAGWSGPGGWNTTRS